MPARIPDAPVTVADILEHRNARIEDRKHDLEELLSAHRAELYLFYHMRAHQDDLTGEKGPGKMVAGQGPAVPDPSDIAGDSDWKRFAEEHKLGNGSISEASFTSEDALRRRLAAELDMMLLAPRDDDSDGEEGNDASSGPDSSQQTYSQSYSQSQYLSASAGSNSASQGTVLTAPSVGGRSQGTSQKRRVEVDIDDKSRRDAKQPAEGIRTNGADVGSSSQANSHHTSGLSPPLHPTLQTLAPNPVSVTYAASLRPLPPDPHRRFTGTGVSGGAIHHRGHRRPPANSSNGPIPPGPAGSGQTDLWRWYVRARASPGAGLVGRADKCLTTADWSVAFREQRFIRAMARIEKLKSAGDWSFRQVKKQKGPVLKKAHWDHVLDEMKWLQTDFREERRWKIAVAYQLAQVCRKWHRARTPAERAALCVPRRRPQENRDDTDANMEVSDGTAQPVEVASEGEGTGDVEMEPPIDAEREDDADGEDEDDEVDAEGEEQDAEGDADDGEVEAVTASLMADRSVPPVEIFNEPRGKDEPMPLLIGDRGTREAGSNETGDVAKPIRDGATGDATLGADVELPMQLVATIRAPIFCMDIGETVVSPSELIAGIDAEAMGSVLGLEASVVAQALNPDEMDIARLFPELPLYDSPALPDPNGKSDRRWDEGSLNLPPRLTHVSRLLDSKPLLVSTLAPSRNRARGRWREDSDWHVAAELADPSKGMSAEAMEAASLPGSVLFTRKSSKAVKEVSAVSNVPPGPASADMRASQFLWSTDEDSYLLTLAKQYNNHWQLVADLYNATRMSVPTDRRDPWDCYDRWKRLQQAAAEGKPAPGPPQLAFDAPDPKTAAGQAAQAKAEPSIPVDPNAIVTHLPSTSLAAKRDRIAKKVVQKYEGSRKKLRRVNLVEVMRKCAKRRDAAVVQQKNAASNSGSGPRRVNLTSHETHQQIRPGPVPSPQQLSKLKQDREEAQRRQFVTMQQQRAQQREHHQAHMQAQQQAQQQQRASGQYPPGQVGPSQQQQQQQQQPNNPQARPAPSAPGQHTFTAGAGSAQVPLPQHMVGQPGGGMGQVQFPPNYRPQMGAHGAPVNLQALQAQLSQGLAASNLSPEQIQTLALALYRQSPQGNGVAAGAGPNGGNPVAAGSSSPHPPQGQLAQQAGGSSSPARPPPQQPHA